MRQFITEITLRFAKTLLDLLEPMLRYGKVDEDPLMTLAPKPLTKKEDLKKVKPYLDRLKKALNERDIHNIAIAGNYGSGKSTIIKTFQQQHPKHRYLNISLASFNDTTKETNSLDNVESQIVTSTSPHKDIEKRLEISILQQMFYQVSPETIPGSRFKRISNLSQWKILHRIVGLLLWLVSVFFLFKLEYFDLLDPNGLDLGLNSLIATFKDINNYSLQNLIVSVSTVIFLLGLGFLLNSFYKYFRNSKISKISIQGELELGSEEDKSIFNKYIDEILYFFERTKYNVVIIEDLDRFQHTDIFQKLREINSLINNCSDVGRSIKFIYAVKDDLFRNKNDRIKFFDYIIPVVPYIDPTNASDQITEMIKNAGIQEVLSPEITSEIVTFIDDIDMRLLMNIFNEYRLYSELFDSGLDQDKLFSILVYKNLFPKDFGLLITRRGNLYKFLSEKELYIKIAKSEFDSRIKAIDKQIDLLEAEDNKPIEELRAVYINTLISTVDGFFKFSIDGKQISQLEVLKDEYFNQIKDAERFTYIGYTHDPTTDTFRRSQLESQSSFKEIENKVSAGQTYKSREQQLYDKHDNKTDQLKSEIKQLKQDIGKIELMSLKELFEVINPDEHLEKFKGNDLVRSLLLNGYIDENYNNYISLFHGITLNKEDFDFIKSVKSKSPLQFDHEITKVDNLVKHISEKQFSHESILNYKLLTFLFDQESKHKVKLENFLHVLGHDGEKQFEFIQGYMIERPDKIDIFIKALCKYKPTLWEYLDKKSRLPVEDKNKLLGYIFSFGDISDISKFTSLGSLRAYLAEMPNFFEFCSLLKGLANITNFIKDKDQPVLFSNLDLPSDVQSNLFNDIYKNNLYRITQDNIAVIAKFLKKSSNESMLSTAPYTTLRGFGLSELLEYIDKNIVEYIKQVWLQQNGNTEEDETVIIELLNRDEIELEHKGEIVKKQNQKITSLSEVMDLAVKQEVIRQNKLAHTWDNIFNYYNTLDPAGFDEILIAMLNVKEVYKDLSKVRLNTVIRDEGQRESFCIDLMSCSQLEKSAYSDLIRSVPGSFSIISFGNLQVDKIEVLIKKKKLDLTKETFINLKAQNSDLSINLIEVHQKEFTEKMEELELDDNDLIKLLNSPIITSSNKLKLLHKIDENIILGNPSLSEMVCNILPLDGQFIKYSYNVLTTMFQSNSSLEKKIMVLNHCFDSLNDEEIKSLVIMLDPSYTRIFTAKKRPSFVTTEYHIELFNKLLSKGLISKVKVDANKEKISVTPAPVGPTQPNEVATT